MSIHVQLERFEGPLGLLLHLIREQEMDIFNINIHHITRQYLDYIRTMRRLDLEVAGEFVAMAATLLQIKSRMLLPQYNEEGEEVTSDDPRKELVQKLIEYSKIKELSGELSKLAWLGRDVFTRGEREVIEPEVAESELILEENPLFSLIASYRAALRNMKKSVHKVSSELQSIAARIMEMRPLLVIGRRVLFRDFITASENVSSQVLVTFLSLLELAKMGLVSVFQSEPFADIHVETKQEVDSDSVSRAENYDSVNSDLKAEEIIHDAQLTLDEPVDALEGEDETVVEASVADAASDADIEAEEARLFGDHVASEVALDSAADEALAAASDFVAEETPVEPLIPELETHAVVDQVAVPESGEPELVEASESVSQDFAESSAPLVSELEVDAATLEETVSQLEAADDGDSVSQGFVESAAPRISAMEAEAAPSNEIEASADDENSVSQEFAESSAPQISDLDAEAAPSNEIETSANAENSVSQDFVESSAPQISEMEAEASPSDELEANADAENPVSQDSAESSAPQISEMEAEASPSDELEANADAENPVSQDSAESPAPPLLNAENPVPQTFEEPTAPPSSDPGATAAKPEHEKLSSALNAAFSAFEAFEEIPTPPTPEPPEVES